MRHIRYWFRQFGPVLLLGGAALFTLILGNPTIAIAAAIGDVTINGAGALTPHFDSYLRKDDRRLDAPGVNASVEAYIKLLRKRLLRSEQLRILGASDERILLGVEGLVRLIEDSGQHGPQLANIRFNLDRRQALDWMRFWTDIPFVPEPEQEFDVRSVALARYSPDIRYWLEGQRWASFDTKLPRGNGAGPSGNSKLSGSAGDINPGSAPQPKILGSANAGQGTGGAADDQSVKAVTLQQFLLSLGESLIRQPIVYIILVISLIVLIVGMRLSPRRKQ